MKATRVLFITLLTVHLFFLLMGTASVTTMLLFYLAVAWGGGIIVSLLQRYSLIKLQRAINIRVLLISSVAALLVSELYLRYAVRDFRSYHEINGDFFYFSEAIHQNTVDLLSRFIPPDETNWFLYNAPSGSESDISGTTICYNSLGLREVEIQYNYSGHDKNYKNLIIGLGDSFTEGVGAADDSNWLKQVEKSLLKSFPVKTLNAGVRGSDPFFAYNLFKYRLADLHPALVLVAVNQTDIDDIIRRGGQERFGENFRINYKPPEWWQYFYSFSFITRHLVHKVLKKDRMFLTADERQAETENAKEKLLRFIQDWAAEAATLKQYKLLFVFHPMAHEIASRSFSLADVCRKVDSLHIPYVDLYTGYLGQGMDESNVYDYYWRVDEHHNAKGYALWAEAVTEKIMRDNMLERQ